MILFLMFTLILTILFLLSFFVGGFLGLLVFHLLAPKPKPEQVMKAGIRWAIALRPSWKDKQ